MQIAGNVTGDVTINGSSSATDGIINQLNFIIEQQRKLIEDLRAQLDLLDKREDDAKIE